MLMQPDNDAPHARAHVRRPPPLRSETPLPIAAPRHLLFRGPSALLARACRRARRPVPSVCCWLNQPLCGTLNIHLSLHYTLLYCTLDALGQFVLVQPEHRSDVHVVRT